MTHRMIGRAVALLFILGYTQGQVRYFGKDLGRLSSLEHGVSGRVFAVDSRTLYIQDLTYDGEGPSAYFYVGTSKSPHSTGATRLRDERGATGPLRKYRGDSVTVSLPEGMTLKDIKWFSIYCDEYEVDFGNVKLPRDLDFPKPARLGALRGVHGVSSDNVVVVDAQTLLVPNFSYDGEAPDAKFWVGRGEKPSPQGVKIPDENGKEAPLRRYDRKTIVLTLPGELTVFDIGHFAVWCEAFTVNFGHVTIPRQQISNVPPSLKMLGVSPQSRNEALVATSPAPRRASTRAPLKRLRATTYRPPGRLPPGPRPESQAQPDAHSTLHRRADDKTPPKQQLVEANPEKSEQATTQKPAATDTQQYSNLQEEYERNQQQIQYYQQLLEQQKQELEKHSQQQPQQSAQLQLQQPQTQQQYEQILQSQYQQNFPQYQPAQFVQHFQQPDPYQQQFYQQQFYQGNLQQEPVQYRLLPYQNTEHTLVDPIQRSIDLDPLSPGSF